MLGEVNKFISKLCDIRGLKFYDIVLYEMYEITKKITITDSKYQFIFKAFAAVVYRFYSLERDKHL